MKRELTKRVDKKKIGQIFKSLFLVVVATIATGCGNKNSSFTFNKVPSSFFSPQFHSPEDPHLFDYGKSQPLPFKANELLAPQKILGSVFTDNDHLIHYHQENFNLQDNNKIVYSPQYGLQGGIIHQVLVSKNYYLDLNSLDDEKKDPNLDCFLRNFSPLYLSPQYANHGNYRPNSLEGVALSVVSHVQKAYNFYLEINNGVDNLPPLTLIIEPPIHKNGFYFTDNAFYAPFDEGDNKNFIVSLPQSDEFLKIIPDALTSRKNFVEFVYQSPVFFHEFGHFVIQNESSMGNKYQSSNVYESFSQIILKSKISSRQKKIEGAFHEGLADIFAKLVANNHPQIFDYFDTNREIENPYFDDQDQSTRFEKKIGTQFLTDLSDPKEEGVFNEVHNAGAVIAHSVYTLISQVFPNNPQLQGKIFILWLREIKKVRVDQNRFASLNLTNNSYSFARFMAQYFNPLFNLVEGSIKREKSLNQQQILRNKIEKIKSDKFSGVLYL